MEEMMAMSSVVNFCNLYPTCNYTLAAGDSLTCSVWLTTKSFYFSKGSVS